MCKYIIGIPKEIKSNETRVAIIPTDIIKIKTLFNNIKIYLQKGAGLKSSYTDNDYINAGVEICETIEELYSKCNLIVKVKEPQESEYNLITDKHVIFSFFHFAGNEKLLKEMINNKSTCIAYETINDNNGYPILTPMSCIAGENAIIEGDKFLKSNNIHITDDTIVSIIGCGNVGKSALNMAINMGYNNFNILDIDENKLKNIEKEYSNKNIKSYKIDENNLKKICEVSNIIIGAIYISGEKTSKIITNDMLDLMNNKSIFIDVSIDQGGMTEQSVPKTYNEPIIKYKNTNIFCVANIPSINGVKASKILSNSILKYLIIILNTNTIKELFNNNIIKEGINVSDGYIYLEAIKKK